MKGQPLPPDRLGLHGGDMHDALAFLRFLKDEAARGRRTVLVTLTAVSGSSARAPGAHMAVSESGASVGSFSGGCVEAAVIAEAQDVLAAGRLRDVRFAAGSPYIDNRLPCGGGIDLLFVLLFVPDPPAIAVKLACAMLEGRHPITLTLSQTHGLKVAPGHSRDSTGWLNGQSCIRHVPSLRLAVLGHGAEPGALLRLARGHGTDAFLLSPDSGCVAEAERLGFPAELLRTTGRSARLCLDAWTAVVMLFHDHDWETELLMQAPEQPPFFIGAMGSRRTHQDRLDRPIAAGTSREQAARVSGPVGLIPAARDPATLAVSILAHVTAAYNETQPPAAPRARKIPSHISDEVCSSLR